jgi:hypothetical protein
MYSLSNHFLQCCDTGGACGMDGQCCMHFLKRHLTHVQCLLAGYNLCTGAAHSLLNWYVSVAGVLLLAAA